jgi:hypothetical protein
MEYDSGLLAPDRWHWVIEQAGPFFSILIAAVVLTATVVWVILRARYQPRIDKLGSKLEEFERNLGTTAEEALHRIDSLQSRLARFEPRHLSGRQKTLLKKLLKLPEAAGMTDINVSHDAACGDGKQYAAEFAHLLRSCDGWRPHIATTFGSGHQPQSGLAIVSFRQGRTAAGAKLLSKAFSDAGIEHETIVSTANQLELVITARLFVPE